MYIRIIRMNHYNYVGVISAYVVDIHCNIYYGCYMYVVGQKLCFFLEKVATSCGFLGPVVSQVVKKDRQFGVSFPEFLEEVTNCFDYLKLETCLTCNVLVLWCAVIRNIEHFNV